MQSSVASCVFGLESVLVPVHIAQDLVLVSVLRKYKHSRQTDTHSPAGTVTHASLTQMAMCSGVGSSTAGSPAAGRGASSGAGPPFPMPREAQLKWNARTREMKSLGHGCVFPRNSARWARQRREPHPQWIFSRMCLAVTIIPIFPHTRKNDGHSTLHLLIG